LGSSYAKYDNTLQRWTGSFPDKVEKKVTNAVANNEKRNNKAAKLLDSRLTQQ